MDPEIKKLLEENLRVTNDTNKILRSLRAQARWGLVGKIILWIALIVIPLYFLQAYLEPYMELIEKQAEGNPDLQKLIDQYRELQ